MLRRIDVDGVFQVGYLHRGVLCSDLHQVTALGQHWVFMHPDQVRLELVTALGWFTGPVQNITLGDINFIFQCQSYSVTLDGMGQVAVHCYDRLDTAAF